MKKILITALLALQSFFSMPAKAQEPETPGTEFQEPRTPSKISQAISNGKVSLVFQSVSPIFNLDKMTDINHIANPGFGIEYRLRLRFHIATGLYQNTLNTPTGYAMLGFETDRRKWRALGLEAGAIAENNSIIPTAMPYLRLGKRLGRVNMKFGALMLVPMMPVEKMSPSDWKSSVFTCQLRYRLGRIRY